MSRNIMLTLRFDGSAYHGWQLQKNAVTVQQKVNEAINCVLHENINVNGCSRTDTGVHAMKFCCNFKTDKSIPCDKLPDAFNAYLPSDISVLHAEEKPMDFHSRFSCVGKEYIYKILNSKYRDPFYENRALLYPYELNDLVLGEEISSFIGTYDFSAFCSSGSEVKDKIRTIRKAEIFREGELVTVLFEGDGFLYNMVRIMVGTLLSINEGRIPVGAVSDIIESKDRNLSGCTSPARGLYLNNVFY